MRFTGYCTFDLHLRTSLSFNKSKTKQKTVLMKSLILKKKKIAPYIQNNGDENTIIVDN